MAVSAPIPSKQTALAELKKLTRQAEAPLPSNELPAALYNALLHHSGGIQKARRAANRPDPPYPKTWTEAKVLDELRRLHDSGVTIRFRDLELCGREDLVGAIRVEIGSIVRARRLARISDPPRAWSEQESWDEDRVIGEILDLARDRQPLAYSKAPSKLRNAAVRYFGGWDAALEAAGLDPDEHRLRRKPYDDEAMLARIRELAREYPEMTLGELHDHPDGLAIWRRFDSIEEAARQAGVEGWPIRKLRDAYSVDETVQALRARNRARKPLSKTRISTDDSRLNLGIQRHFRTMEAALTEAGLESKLPDTVRWSREEVLRQLEGRRDAGKPLHASAVPATLHAAAIKFFGSYMAAAKRFGAKPLKVNWTRETVLAELRRLASQNKTLSTSDVPNGVLKAARRFFGTWEEICAVARIEGLDHAPRGHWTRDRIIDTLRERVRNGQPVAGNSIGKALIAACWRQFGGLDDALRAASVER
jgi:hypothetical protein